MVSPGLHLRRPLTLPVLRFALSRRIALPWRVAAVLIAGLTAAEVAWALSYLAVREARPWIWLLPMVVGLAILAAFARARARPGHAVA